MKRNEENVSENVRLQECAGKKNAMITIAGAKKYIRTVIKHALYNV